jgi:hypothetical protein
VYELDKEDHDWYFHDDDEGEERRVSFRTSSDDEDYVSNYRGTQTRMFMSTNSH